MQILRRTLRPEFLNRIDDVILFGLLPGNRSPR
jgi:ATP-dependent Clp protease ATP-binding subunit ClpA